MPLIEHALDQFKTVPFADETDAHHEDAKWQSKGKSDDLCGVGVPHPLHQPKVLIAYRTTKD